MKEKPFPAKKYHFDKLPYLPKLTIAEAEKSVIRINELLGAVRRELYYFNDQRGYLLLGYKNMAAFVKLRVTEVSPRYVRGLLDTTKTENSMELNSPIGTVPYLALKLLKSFPVDIMKDLWVKSSYEQLTGESITNSLKRVIIEYKAANK